MRTWTTLAVLLVACSHSSATAVHGPDGSPMWAIDCTHSASNCMEAAGDKCPAGYETVGSYHDVAQAANNVLDTSQGTHDVYHGSMLIRCK